MELGIRNGTKYPPFDVIVNNGDTLYEKFPFTFPAVVLKNEVCRLLRIRARRPVAFTAIFHLPTGRLDTKPSMNSLIWPAFAPVTEVTPVAGLKLGFCMMRLLEKLKPF